MSNQGLLYDNGLLDFASAQMATEDDVQRQNLLKDQINLYYDDYYVKPKRKKSSKAKRSQSKRPGAGKSIYDPNNLIAINTKKGAMQSFVGHSGVAYKSPKNIQKKKSVTKKVKPLYTTSSNHRYESAKYNERPSVSHPKPVTRKISTPSAPGYNLTDTEKLQYGNRIAAGYKKLDLLGKGG
mmetsp:Transcript_26729/g.23594  ORF Transcript_26729/g.23594 Transcript_26729/m.23594 type:complete len:182 (+) Transcript_26729:18-563(+)